MLLRLKLLRTCWPALVLALIGLIGGSGIAQSAKTIVFSDPDETEIRVAVGDRIARVSRDGGATWTRLGSPDPRVMLRYHPHDPLARPATIPFPLQAPPGNTLWVVQYVSPSIDEYRASLRALGAEIFQFIPWQATIARMTPDVADRVARLPFVRWVGPLDLAYRLEPELIDEFLSGLPIPTRRYHVMQLDWTEAGHRRFLAALEREGVEVVHPHHGSVFVDVRLTGPALRRIVARNDVLWIDRSTAIEHDVDNARTQSGAKAIQASGPLGYTGKGIRGYNTEGIHASHPEFAAVSPYRNAPIRHRSNLADSHGTSVNGIVFSRGAQANAKGMLPDAQCIAADNGVVGSMRNTIVSEAVDPNMNYRAMFMTASWGSQRTTRYTSDSVQMDQILFKHDIAHTQSQSNAGSTANPQMSRPQAWAKNVISVGGFQHMDNAVPNDDRWNKTGSIGPAEDGRIKPDVAAYYEDVRTTSGSSGYTSTFGGTSAATPIVAGSVGLILEMFTDGLFGNKLPMPATWQNRFANRPHMTTTKALLVNTARRYAMQVNNNLRVHVGYGMPDVKELYDRRNNMLVVNETEVLRQGTSRTWLTWVKPGTGELAATLCFADPAGTANTNVHRVNNLDLRVVAPDGTFYWGNRGLKSANYNTPGSTANGKDTLENVFVQNPASGIWEVRVGAPEVNRDGHVETAATDADFALVVSGIGAMRDTTGPTLALTSQSSSDLKVALTNLPSGWTTGRTVFSLATGRPVGFGWVFGLEMDALTIATWHLNVAPFYFTSSTQFPAAPYSFPAAIAQGLRGLPLDAVAIVFQNGVPVGVSNAARVTIP